MYKISTVAYNKINKNNQTRQLSKFDNSVVYKLNWNYYKCHCIGQTGWSFNRTFTEHINITKFKPRQPPQRSWTVIYGNIGSESLATAFGFPLNTTRSFFRHTLSVTIHWFWESGLTTLRQHTLTKVEINPNFTYKHKR